MEANKMDERIKVLARNLVNYSMEVKAGEKVFIEHFGPATQNLARQIVKEVYKAGGVPFVRYTDTRLPREILLNCSQEQMALMGKQDAAIMSEMDCYVGIRGNDNVSELSDVPAEKMNIFETYYMTPVHHNIRVPKTKWVVLRYPNNSMAQLANTSLEDFEDFYFRVCNLDYANMGAAMQKLKDYMERTDRVRIVGPGTDLSFSIKNIPAVSCDGKCNIPDGEVYTAPVRESVNGVLTYNTPAVF